MAAGPRLKSRTTKRFRELLAALPDEVQVRARHAYRLFRENPRHPSLQFKKVHTKLPIYAARVTLDYRALSTIEADTAIWFWIGSHAEYERILGAL
jgi:hypothetical protein